MAIGAAKGHIREISAVILGRRRARDASHFGLRRREIDMHDLSIRCPETDKKIDTGVDTNYKSLALLWNVEITVPCSHCGQSHKVLVRDAYMDQAALDFA